jgi:hypothetical protein
MTEQLMAVKQQPVHFLLVLSYFNVNFNSNSNTVEIVVHSAAAGVGD